MKSDVGNLNVVDLDDAPGGFDDAEQSEGERGLASSGAPNNTHL